MWNSYATLPDIGWIKSDKELSPGDTVFVNDSEFGAHIWITVDSVTEGKERLLPSHKFENGKYTGTEYIKFKTKVANITLHKGMGQPPGARNDICVFID